MVGPLVKQKVLSPVKDCARVIEAADHLLEFKLDQMALRGQERVVASVVGQRELNAVQRIAAQDFGQIGNLRGNITDVDVLTTVRHDRRQVVLGPVVTERNAPADPLLVVVEIPPIKERSAEPKADWRVPQIRLAEADQIA